MIHSFRLIICIVLLTGLTGCVSTEELYARYDNQMCPVAQTAIPGMKWHNAIFFPYNQSEVAVEEESKLRDNLELLNQNPGYRVILRGFADSIASQRYNLPLSKRRAQFIANWLVDNGISRERIDLIGLGKELLLTVPIKGLDEQTNRRVEMLLVDDEGRPVTLEQPFNDSGENSNAVTEEPVIGGSA